MARFGAVAMIALLLLLVEAPMLSTSQGCGSLFPCLAYLKGGALQSSCCSAVKKVKAAANTRAKRQSVCNCIHGVLRNKSINSGRLSGLPSLCGANLGFGISTRTVCSRIP